MKMPKRIHNTPKILTYANGVDLNFFGLSLHDGSDFRISFSNVAKTYDFLFFFDSRGMRVSEGTPLVLMLEAAATKLGMSYISISRPMNLTTWVTLQNFLELNDFVFREVITNVGFVDFTPKKESILHELSTQFCRGEFQSMCIEKIFLETFINDMGVQIDLFRNLYPPQFLLTCIATARRNKITLINTPSISTKFKFVRKRPKSFFSQIDVGNGFNKEVIGGSSISSSLLEPGEFSKLETYDGVHYTEFGCRKMFQLFSMKSTSQLGKVANTRQ